MNSHKVLNKELQETLQPIGVLFTFRIGQALVANESGRARMDSHPVHTRLVPECT